MLRPIALALLAALATPAIAADLPPAPAAPANTASPSGAVPSTVLRETFANGLRVVVVPDRLAPVVTTQLTILAGSNDAPPGFPGMAHALEHMMFRGAKGLDKDQLYELGDLLGGDYNANTEETVTNYTYTVPATDLDLILRAEALRMTGATLLQPDWEAERGAIEQEVSRDLSNPMYEVLSHITATLFAGTTYEHDALGTRESFDKTDAAMLRRFYETWYHPNNAILVIAGDVEPGRAMDLARAAFSALPRVEVPPHPSAVFATTAAKTITTLSNLPVGLVGIAYRMPGLASPELATAAILTEVLASDRAPLYGLSVSGQALATGFEFSPKTDVGIGLAYGAFPAGQDPAPLIANLRRVLAAAADGDIPAPLVEAAKRFKIAQLAFATDNISGLAKSWSRAIAVAGLNSPDDIARAYQAVTVEDVRKLARSVLVENQAVTAIVTPRGDNQPAAAAGFGGAESIGSPPDHPVTLPDWAADALAAVKAPDPGTPPEVTVLPNGLRLIVQPEHVSRTVSVYGSIRTNAALQEPAGKEGVAAIAGQLFNYGTVSHDRIAFSAAVDDLAATEGAGTQFTLKVLSDRFEAGMRLLAENELHPALPEQAFTVVRQQAAQSLAGRLRSAPYLFERAKRAAIVPAEDPSLRQATPATVGNVTLDDVRAIIAAQYRPDLTTIVIVGDVTAADALRVVTDTFGGWKAPEGTATVDLAPIAPSGPTRQRIGDPSTVQDDVALLEAITLPVASPERYTLTLGNTILGSGFSSRLFRDLRTRTGYVYSEQSRLDFSRTRGTYSVTFGADPKNVAAARALVLRDIEDMQKTPVSEAELTRAKAQMLRRLAMSRASVGAIAGLYLTQIELGLPLDSQVRAAAQYQAATAEQIRQAFATWLRPADLSEIVRGPASE
jgi:zinc protease